MKEFRTLGSWLLFFLVILHETQQYDSHLGVVVNIDVDGWDVVKTGIREYSFADSHFVTIKCSAVISSAANISLLDSHGQPIISNVSSRNEITVVTKRLRQPVGKYYCLLNIPIWSLNDSYSELVISSEVDIIQESVLPLYASSVGNSRYVGERAFLYFTKVGRISPSCSVEKSSENEREFFIDGNFPEEKCVCYYYSRYKKCSVLRLSVYPFLKLNIYEENVTLDSSVMEFSCNSTPPRLMYWKMFGSHGNLFDFDNIDHSISVNITANITQSPGKTTLRIWETVPGGNGIHTVMCSTYDTDKRVVAFLPVTTPSVCNSDCASSDLKQTDMPESTTTTTHKSGTFVMTTTDLEGHYDDTEVQASTEQECEMKTYTLNGYVLTTYVSAPYLVIILLLFGIICYMHHKNRRSLKMEFTTELKVDHTLPETVLHDNPAYLSFSETNGYSPENENDEKTYANL
ncbi:hypothetical protein HOLleu_17379 [Holothuria leucospilota]|uniref:Ig-like domain-containing protein n=1 Tax=Holothuria leucospilota TaxID=206669 RepID=A0A9Q1C5E8_HOLLE|nr:hypothetical protein HOLleu_17379 [Holothuria leucospilota]